MKEDKAVLIFMVWLVFAGVASCVFLHNPTPLTLQVIEIALLSGPVFVAICILLNFVRKEL